MKTTEFAIVTDRLRRKIDLLFSDTGTMQDIEDLRRLDALPIAELRADEFPEPFQPEGDVWSKADLEKIGIVA